MSGGLVVLFDDELSRLGADRRAHSLAVGQKAAGVAQLVVPALRSDLVTAAALHDVGYAHRVTAAALHDVGYAHRVTGFHALDGARYLAGQGFSPVCVRWWFITRRAPWRPRSVAWIWLSMTSSTTVVILGPLTRCCGGRI